MESKHEHLDGYLETDRISSTPGSPWRGLSLSPIARFPCSLGTVGASLSGRSAALGPASPAALRITGRWALAARLAAQPLETDDGPKPLRLDSNANLLAWQHPLLAADQQQSRAMHRIFPRLITVPGVEELVLHLNSSLSRLWTSGPGKLKFAWVDFGPDRLIAELGLKWQQQDQEW